MLFNSFSRPPNGEGSRHPDLPAEFDPGEYIRWNPDLAHMTEEEAKAHWSAYGFTEGRIPSSGALREELVKLIAKEETVLEIGPFYCPCVTGRQVRYFDVLNTQALIARARAHGLATENIPEIHFVSPIGDLSVVPEKFTAVISSHAIEHQPDLIRHFQQVADLLEPGGRYYLVIPDKRFCFDYPFPPTTAADVRAAHAARRTRHSLKSVMEHFSLTTHNDPVRHWDGDHYNADYFQQLPARVIAAVQEYEAAGEAYIDVHAWQFTPESTRALYQELIDGGDIPFTLDRVFETPHHRIEFTAVLSRAQV